MRGSQCNFVVATLTGVLRVLDQSSESNELGFYLVRALELQLDEYDTG
jgi:hypothetical protein